MVTDRRQFKSNRNAMRFLKHIDNLHELHRISIIGKKPIKKDFKKTLGRKKYYSREDYSKVVINWRGQLNKIMPLKVEIINTKQNQYSTKI